MPRPRTPRALLLAWALTAPAARGDDVQVRLEYDAPASCPSAADFQREVEARLTRGRITAGGSLARTYRVKITLSDAGARGTLDFTDADGTRASRDVSGATCAEAATAMALIAALAIDARVAEEESRPEVRPPAPPAAPQPSVEPPRPAPPPAVRAPEAPPVRSGQSVLGVGASVGVEHSYAPDVAASVAAVGELLHGEHALRLALVYSSTGPVEVDAGTVELSLYALRAQGCPLRLAPGRSLALVPCAGLEGGLVRARGRRSERIVHPNSVSRGWLSGSVALRVELAPDPALSFGVEGALGFPLTRHEFVLEKPETVVHEVPPVTFGASAGLVARFE